MKFFFRIAGFLIDKRKEVGELGNIGLELAEKGTGIGIQAGKGGVEIGKSTAIKIIAPVAKTTQVMTESVTGSAIKTLEGTVQTVGRGSEVLGKVGVGIADGAANVVDKVVGTVMKSPGKVVVSLGKGFAEVRDGLTGGIQKEREHKLDMEKEKTKQQQSHLNHQEQMRKNEHSHEHDIKKTDLAIEKMKAKCNESEQKKEIVNSFLEYHANQTATEIKSQSNQIIIPALLALAGFLLLYKVDKDSPTIVGLGGFGLILGGLIFYYMAQKDNKEYRNKNLPTISVPNVTVSHRGEITYTRSNQMIQDEEKNINSHSRHRFLPPSQTNQSENLSELTDRTFGLD